MNDAVTTETDVQPEVRAFVERVRANLGDLDEEVRDELAGGLEADIADLVAERGSEALPDPQAYADELRASAGLPARAQHRLRKPTVSLRKPGRTWAETVDGWLDSAGARWRAFAGSEWRRPLWEGLVLLRPAWWLLRAWVVVVTVDLLTGPAEKPDLIPQFGVPLLGPAILTAMAVLSIQVGRGVWWPGSAAPGSTRARLVLLAVNAATLVLAPAMVGRAADDQVVYSYYASPTPMRDGLVSGGHVVKNVYAFDASGRPIQGVQLFDQNGDPLAVNPGNAFGRAGRHGWWVAYPWMNGTKELWNVFPLPIREQPRPARSDLAWGEPDRPSIDTSVMAGTAQATLPGDGPTSAPASPSSSPSTSPSAGEPTDSEKPAPR